MNSMPTPSAGSQAAPGAGSPSDGPVPGLALPLGGPVNEATTEMPLVVPRDRATGMSIEDQVSVVETPAKHAEEATPTTDGLGRTTGNGLDGPTADGVDGPTADAGAGAEPVADAGAGAEPVADSTEEDVEDEAPVDAENVDAEKEAAEQDAVAEPALRDPDGDATDEPEDDEPEADEYDNDEHDETDEDDEEDEDDVDAVDSDVDSDAVASAVGAAGSAGPVTGATTSPGDSADGQIAIWDLEDAEKMRTEWHELKALFVDDPAAAVAQAQILLTTAVQTLAEALLAKQVDLDPRRQAAVPDTEAMRVAMRSYREFLDRLLAL